MPPGRPATISAGHTRSVTRSRVPCTAFLLCFLIFSGAMLWSTHSRSYSFASTFPSISSLPIHLPAARTSPALHHNHTREAQLPPCIADSRPHPAAASCLITTTASRCELSSCALRQSCSSCTEGMRRGSRCCKSNTTPEFLESASAGAAIGGNFCYNRGFVLLEPMTLFARICKWGLFLLEPASIFVATIYDFC